MGACAAFFCQWLLDHPYCKNCCRTESFHHELAFQLCFNLVATTLYDWVKFRSLVRINNGCQTTRFVNAVTTMKVFIIYYQSCFNSSCCNYLSNHVLIHLVVIVITYYNNPNANLTQPLTLT